MKIMCWFDESNDKSNKSWIRYRKNVSKLFFPLQTYNAVIVTIIRKNNYNKNNVFYSVQLYHYLIFISPANISYLSITKQPFTKLILSFWWYTITVYNLINYRI